MGETVYWLKLVSTAGLSSTNELAEWIDEGRQLVRILAASSRTAKGRVAVNAAAD